MNRALICHQEVALWYGSCQVFFVNCFCTFTFMFGECAFPASNLVKKNFFWVFIYAFIFVISNWTLMGKKTWIIMIIILVSTSVIHWAIRSSHEYSSAWHTTLHKMPERRAPSISSALNVFLYWHPSGGMKLPHLSKQLSLLLSFNIKTHHVNKHLKEQQ